MSLADQMAVLHDLHEESGHCVGGRTPLDRAARDACNEWLWSGSGSWSGSRSGSRVQWWSSQEEEDCMVGETVILETVVGRVLVGRLVRRDAAETVITDVVRLNDCGVWEQFVRGAHQGMKLNDGRDEPLHGSAEVEGEELSIPTQIVLGPRRWPGDLAALRKACGA